MTATRTEILTPSSLHPAKDSRIFSPAVIQAPQGPSIHDRLRASVSQPIRTYINETSLNVAQGSTVLDAVRSFSSEAAEALEGGQGYVTDGAGRPISLEERVSSGSIYRFVGAATGRAEPTS